MPNRIKIVTGHYGSGKTEFSINYAISKAMQGEKVLLADLDIVNPFFRSREKKKFLSQWGISVISSSVAEEGGADLPALSPQLMSLFIKPLFEKVIDVGGDATGARVLSRFREYFSASPYEMWMVVNANRPETQTAEQVIAFMESIERSSRLKISGLINNTHMMKETTLQDVYKGDELCRKVKDRTGTDIRFTCTFNNPCRNPSDGLEGEMMPIKVYVSPSWMF